MRRIVPYRLFLCMKGILIIFRIRFTLKGSTIRRSQFLLLGSSGLQLVRHDLSFPNTPMAGGTKHLRSSKSGCPFFVITRRVAECIGGNNSRIPKKKCGRITPSRPLRNAS